MTTATRRGTGLLLLLLSLAAGCGKGSSEPARAPDPAPAPALDDAAAAAPAPPTFAPVAERAVRDLCADPALLERARKALPQRQLCERERAAAAIEVAAGERTILVVASPAQGITTRSGSGRSQVHELPPLVDVVVDGASLGTAPGLGRRQFWTELGPLTDLQPGAARALLESVLLGLDGEWTITADERTALEAGWPRARALIERDPPGAAHGSEHRLRAWRTHERLSPGVDCRYLERHEVTLKADGAVEVAEPERWAEGNAHGEPCGAALPEPDPEAAHCPGESPAPAAVDAEVERLLRVVAAHASASGGCYDGYGGSQVELVEHGSWLHDRGADRFAVSVRFRLARTRLCGDTRGQPGGCSPHTDHIDGCLRVAFERGDGDRYRLRVPGRLAGLRTLMMTPLDQTHDGSCFGKSGAFRARSITLAAD